MFVLFLVPKLSFRKTSNAPIPAKKSKKGCSYKLKSLKTSIVRYCF